MAFIFCVVCFSVSMFYVAKYVRAINSESPDGTVSCHDMKLYRLIIQSSVIFSLIALNI
jgi:hypothetical protein